MEDTQPYIYDTRTHAACAWRAAHAALPARSASYTRAHVRVRHAHCARQRGYAARESGRARPHALCVRARTAHQHIYVLVLLLLGGMWASVLL